VPQPLAAAQAAGAALSLSGNGKGLRPAEDKYNSPAPNKGAQICPETGARGAVRARKAKTSHPLWRRRRRRPQGQKVGPNKAAGECWPLARGSSGVWFSPDWAGRVELGPALNDCGGGFGGSAPRDLAQKWPPLSLWGKTDGAWPSGASLEPQSRQIYLDQWGSAEAKWPKLSGLAWQASEIHASLARSLFRFQT